MDLGPIIVILIRLLVPFAIFRWPFWGILAAGAVDAFDVVMIDALNMGHFTQYHSLDKILDTYFLVFAVIVSFRWMALAKWTSVSLFSYRIIGVILFEITKIRIFLFLFPNLFLYFFMFEAFRQQYFPKWELTPKRLIIVLLILLIPKMIQEYVLHFAELKPWGLFKERFLSSIFKS